MDATTINRLLEVNKSFYQNFAEQFSATRRRLQPGVQRILERIDPEARILDLGCGNGELARNLFLRGHRGLYVGIDLSAELLEQARNRIKPQAKFPAYFIQADLSSPGWDLELPVQTFDILLAFAVLHHLPGKSIRRRVLESVHSLLNPKGQFIHSEWQFLNSSRLQARIQPWRIINLSDQQVEDGDYLLDWRQGGLGFRYIHHFTLDELDSLAKEVGFSISETFSSDGENGILGLYQVWEKTNH